MPKTLPVLVILLSGFGFSASVPTGDVLPFFASDAVPLPFSGNGSFGTKLLVDGIAIDMPPSTGCSGSRCSLRITVQAPEGRGLSAVTKHPLVIVSPGFMVGLDRYETYAQKLTSWGFIAVRWETQNEFLPFYVNSHETLARMVLSLVEWVIQQAADSHSLLYGLVDLTPGVCLVGHSRGAKANSLLASWRSVDVAAVVNLDPVDISGFDTGEMRVLPLLANASAAFLTIGSQLGPETFAGSACAPAGENYREFYAESKSPAWLLQVLEAGHMQFLDDAPSRCVRCSIIRALCVEGPLPDWVVRGVSQTAMVAWLKNATEGASLEPYQQGWAAYLDKAGVAWSHTK